LGQIYFKAVLNLETFWPILGEPMSDNVLILGAGFSHDAGIPLLRDFVEKMWEISIRGKVGDAPLSDEDQKIFRNALGVRNSLNRYHGRANFDDRNLEDILSILSFNVMAEGRSARNSFEALTAAIARTIELTCTVNHPGVGPFPAVGRLIENKQPTPYANFWHRLFEWTRKGNSLPAIVTFNYDLVLERSLLELLIGVTYNSRNDSLPPFSAFRVDYHYDRVVDLAFKVCHVKHEFGRLGNSRPGTALELLDSSKSVCEKSLLSRIAVGLR